jgi:hypothetical protein
MYNTFIIKMLQSCIKKYFIKKTNIHRMNSGT